MSALPLALLAQLTLSCPAASSFPAGQVLSRVAATAQAESGLQTTAVHDNTTDRSYAPATETEAIVLATTLRQQSHSIDAGLMQINDKNWQRLGLTAETAFDPRLNICAGMTILAEAYAIERRVSCRYNSGRPDCTNGYPERIDTALRRVRAQGGDIVSAAGSARDFPTAPAPVDVFVKHGSEREMVFSRSAAPSKLEARPPTPAAPDSRITNSEQSPGELINVRSVER